MCKPGWLKYEGHCYFRNKTGDTWMNAKVFPSISMLYAVLLKFVLEHFVKNVFKTKLNLIHCLQK